MTHNTPCQLFLLAGSLLLADTALLPERENKGPSSTNLQTLLLMCPALSSHWPRGTCQVLSMESYLLCQIPQGSPEGQAVGSAPGDATTLMGRGGMGCGIHVLILPFLLPHSPKAEHRAGKSCVKVKEESKGIAWINTSAGLAKLLRKDLL